MTVQVDPLRDAIKAIVVEEVARALAERPVEQADELIKTSEAAAIAKVHLGSVQRWVQQGRLTRRYAGRQLRVSRRELDRLLRKGPNRNELSPEEEADLDSS